MEAKIRSRFGGVAIDAVFTLDAHFEDILTKAQIRQGILNTVAGSSRCLEVGVLRMTHVAVITSFLQYALTVTGPVLPPDFLRNLNTQVANVAAREIGGMSRTIRIESTHYLLGTDSVYNLYLRRCAGFLDQCLRASGSSIYERLGKSLPNIIELAPLTHKR